MYNLKQCFELPFKWHLFFGILIRISLIFYGDFHDNTYDVPYTDIDYKVFTDAARYVTNGQSPYKRHTYRYSPIIAFLMIPNVVLAKNFGKFLFSFFDILISVAVKKVIENQLRNKAKGATVSEIAVLCSLSWLYNPLSIAISTRGNADSFPCFLIILSVSFLLTDFARGHLKHVLSGIFLGISIHLRLYPMAFSFPMYLSLGKYNIHRRTSLKDALFNLLPNSKQILLATSCATTLVLLTYGMYILYGRDFVFESYIYHLFRKDTRHNFSILFYYSYLTDNLSFVSVKLLSQMFECSILFGLSLSFGCEQKTLSFAMFCQAVVLVAYNSVMTSQYFIWFLSLLPLVAHSFTISRLKASLLICLWFLSQGAWLFVAYLLEFRGQQVFFLIWFKSVLFFVTNIFILGCLIKNFNPDYGFGKLQRDLKKEN